MGKALAKVKRQLPATIEGLREFIIIGKERLNAQKAKIRAIEKIDKAHVAKDAATQDAIDVAELVIYAEAKLGGMINDLPSPSGRKAGKGGVEKKLPPGITHKESHQAQLIANNLAVAEQVIAEAIEKERIPTSWDVIKKVYNLQKQKPQEKPLLVTGKYKTVIIDPPWPVEKILRKERPYQKGSLDYQTMTIEAIKDSQFPFDENCHVYLWTIQRFLRIAFECFDSWSVKYVQTLVWHKNVGFTPHNLFMNNVEFVLFGKIGTLELLRAGEKCVFVSKVREHSRKPDEFYELVKRVSPEPRIDFFSREKRDGFKQFGNETKKF